MSKIFISRVLNKNSTFKKVLNTTGMDIIHQSLIQFSAVPFKEIPKVDWIFFYSKNGVKFFFENFDLASNLQIFKWGTIGKGTAETLASYHIKPDFVGSGHPTSTASSFQKVASQKKVLFIQAKTSKKSIQQLLEQQIEVFDLVVYQNEAKLNFDIPYCEFLVFTSPLNAQTYFQKYRFQKKQKVIAIGTTTASAIQQLGIPSILVAEKPTEEAMAQQITQQLIMSNRFAVIDLGTNTFHLLVAEKNKDQPFKELHRQRFFIKLAEEGIETIGEAPIKRGLHALKTFRATLDQLDVTQVKAIGTAALRTASNGSAFIQQVKESYGINIELIDGNREAELIYKGVHLAVPFQPENYLIMDIGGGSVEFIIANQEEVLWAQSFPIGVAVLYKNFHLSDPIASSETTALQVFLHNTLTPLYAALTQYPAKTLVGASGTFDVLEFILAKEQSFDNHAFVKVKDFAPLYQLLLHSTHEERFAMKDVPDTRADMIVVAVILIDFILNKVGIENIIVSNFALKEGVLSEMMQ